MSGSDKDFTKKYFRENNLDQLIDQKNLPDKVVSSLNDLVYLHKLIREQKSFTVLEFGVGYSSIVIADALAKNEEEYFMSGKKVNIRNRFKFQLFSVDASKKWIGKTKKMAPELLIDRMNFIFSKVKISTFGGQLCHFYTNLPDIVPDFVYLDGPDPKDVQGEINGLSFQCEERTVMSADLLLMEATFLPGTTILVDGRTNNARFLNRHFTRSWSMDWKRSQDVSVFNLDEEPLGKFNIY